ILALSLLPGSLAVLYPARLMKSLGIYSGPEFGDFPSRVESGQGEFYSRTDRNPEFFEHEPKYKTHERDFDSVASIYSSLVGISSVPVVEESLRLIERLITPNSRILDLSCGPGKEVPSLAALVPEGEVVAVDLSAGMIREAYRNSKSLNVRNVA